MKVVFNNTSEFLDEIDTQIRVNGPPPEMVRVTTCRKQNPQFVTLFHFSLLASYVNCFHQVVELEFYVGEAMTGETKTLDELERHRLRLERDLHDREIKIRRGRLVP